MVPATAAPKLSIEYGPGIGPSASTSTEKYMSARTAHHAFDEGVCNAGQPRAARSTSHPLSGGLTRRVRRGTIHL
ncbi:hypothetical protein GCM10009661_06860 [Catellatospora chokoriensis]|uniref:Uncharacterized protein n=2 Tax=Catellatospora TaxID=53365 RepID=A0A8J3KCX3_9ACTN|nr:hypothetical protein Cch02nite_17680 [Catellatospora chokoriensis]GIF97357.1 hypothetical protein Cci01nite_24510 [Catellatospora citrea]